MSSSISIKKDGLQAYLDNTRSSHNGFGYDSFVSMVELEYRPSTASMAKIFSVSYKTMEKWILVYKLEQKT